MDKMKIWLVKSSDIYNLHENYERAFLTKEEALVYINSINDNLYAYVEPIDTEGKLKNLLKASSESGGKDL